MNHSHHLTNLSSSDLNAVSGGCTTVANPFGPSPLCPDPFEYPYLHLPPLRMLPTKKNK